MFAFLSERWNGVLLNIMQLFCGCIENVQENDNSLKLISDILCMNPFPTT